MQVSCGNLADRYCVPPVLSDTRKYFFYITLHSRVAESSPPWWWPGRLPHEGEIAVLGQQSAVHLDLTIICLILFPWIWNSSGLSKLYSYESYVAEQLKDISPVQLVSTVASMQTCRQEFWVSHIIKLIRCSYSTSIAIRYSPIPSTCPNHRNTL